MTLGAAGPADAGGEQVSLSHDGRFVAFRSAATNRSRAAVEPGREQHTDVFVRDRLTGATILATRPGPPGNAMDPTISADGRRVAFVSAPAPLEPGELYVADVASGRTTFVSRGLRGYGHGWSRAPSKLYADGRLVVFVRRRGPREDLYVHDLARHRSTRVAPGPARAFVGGPSISADGRYVAWSDVRLAGDADIVTVYRSRWRTRRRTRVDRYLAVPGLVGEGGYRTALSGNGRDVAYSMMHYHPDTERGRLRVLRRDMRTGRRRVASRTALGGVRGRLGGISADGRYFSFGVDLPALVRDLERGVTTPLAPQAAYLGASPSISGDGAWVAFTATVGGILQSYACPRTDCAS